MSGRTALAVTLTFSVWDAPRMRAWGGEQFDPDVIELVYNRFGDAWTLFSVEVGGAWVAAPHRDYRGARLFANQLDAAPQWVRDFVASVDVAAELARGSS